jgi:hypothetical protein
MTPNTMLRVTVRTSADPVDIGKRSDPICVPQGSTVIGGASTSSGQDRIVWPLRRASVAGERAPALPGCTGELEQFSAAGHRPGSVPRLGSGCRLKEGSRANARPASLITRA